jgi:hypothetical protein
LSTETLLLTFAEVAGNLGRSGIQQQKQLIGSLREYMDEIERRLLAK